MLSPHKIKTIIESIFKMAYEEDILALSSQLAYNLLLAFFPFIIFLMTIVGYSDIDSRYIMEGLKEMIPNEAYKLVHGIVLQVVHSHNGSLMSISFIVTIWSAASGFNAVIKGLNKAYKEKELRNMFHVQMISIIFTLALVIVIMFAVLLLVFGEMNGYLIARWFGFSKLFQIFWNAVRYIFTAFIMVIGFGLLYKYAPCKRHTFRAVMPGAIFSAVGWILSSLCFSFYVNNFSNYSKVYGSIGAVIILMLWLLISSVIILIGGQINSVCIKEATLNNK